MASTIICMRYMDGMFIHSVAISTLTGSYVRQRRDGCVHWRASKIYGISMGHVKWIFLSYLNRLRIWCQWLDDEIGACRIDDSIGVWGPGRAIHWYWHLCQGWAQHPTPGPDLYTTIFTSCTSNISKSITCLFQLLAGQLEHQQNKFKDKVKQLY